jgi:hypothetical protein
MSRDTYNGRLFTANMIVSLINVLMPAISWVLWCYYPRFWIAYLIVGESGNLCLVLSCVILVLGFKKLISVVTSDQHLVDKQMIIWHIIAYILIVFAFFVEGFFVGWSTPI